MKHAVVGRDAERAALDVLLGGAERETAALVLDGEAGIGKTTLWRSGVQAARGRGYRVFSCRPANSENALPFVSLGDLLDSGLAGELDHVATSHRRVLEAALARVEPGEALTRLAVMRAVLTVVRDLSSEQPVLIAIDDVQWLDSASADVVEFVARRVAGRRLRFLIARRSSREERLPLGLDQCLPRERIVDLRLEPLSVGDLDGMLRATLELGLPRPQLVELHATSGGNPFFALEIARSALRRAGTRSKLALDVPESLAALLQERLSTLSDVARDAILLAAAEAHPTSAAVERAAGQVGGLAESIDAGILELQRDRLFFTHPLLASVSYQSAPPWERRDAHRRLAAGAVDVVERARHLALAIDGSDEGVAMQLDAAADQAAARGAPAIAANLSDHACRVTPPESARLVERVVRSAQFHVMAGNAHRSRELLEEGVGLAAPGRERARVLWRLGQVTYISDKVPAATEIFRRALAEAGDDLALRVHLEQALAFTAPLSGDIPAGVAHARAAHELADRLQDSGALSVALAREAATALLAGEGLDRAKLERSLELEKPDAEMPVEWSPRYTYATLAMFADDFDTARQLYAGIYATAVELGNEHALSTLLFQMSQLECWSGNWELADRYATEAVERSRQSGQRQVQAHALYARALVDAHTGRVEEARASAEEGLRLAHDAGAVAPMTQIVPVLGFLELSLGNPAAAHETLAPLAEMVAGMGLGDPGVVRFLPDEIEALIALGRLDDAEQRLLLLEERGRAVERVSALAAAARCRALLESARGADEAARASLTAAHAFHARLDQPFERARTLLAEGTIARRARRRSGARDALTSSLEIFDALGAARWSEKAAGELARIPGRPPADGELSATERRVAELVAAGGTNREVGAALFVTERTVEGHLSRIYAKLGLRSRADLIRYLGDRPAAETARQ